MYHGPPTEIKRRADMRRNIEVYAEAGARKIEQAKWYDLTTEEMFQLGDKAKSEGTFTAIITAYNAGFEAGTRYGAKKPK